MNYQDFDKYQFASDEVFQKWVTEPSPETTAFWATFSEAYPNKKETIEQAKNMIIQVSAAEKRTVSEKVVTEIWQNIEQNVDFEESNIEQLPRPTRTWLCVGIVLVVLLGGGYFAWQKWQCSFASTVK